MKAESGARKGSLGGPHPHHKDNLFTDVYFGAVLDRIFNLNHANDDYVDSQKMELKDDKACARIRNATRRDIPAIVCLVLTSFRQFPLFDYLYSPLRHNKENAHDTIFAWRRRVLLELLDPSVIVQVAEVNGDYPSVVLGSDQGDNPVLEESWNMLRWLESNSGLSQACNDKTHALIVGFSIWQDRLGVDTPSTDKTTLPQPSWISRLRRLWTKLEMKVWSKLHQRQDQDIARYREYEQAENTLEAEFYRTRCFYLDNLCVDFRYQRKGIGQELLEKGIQMARQKRLAIGTEASPGGAGLYLKSGFHEIGRWQVGPFEIPVMRLPAL